MQNIDQFIDTRLNRNVLNSFGQTPELWNEKAVAILTKMVVEKQATGEEIAKALQHTTGHYYSRNAVLGKIFRLKLRDKYPSPVHVARMKARSERKTKGPKTEVRATGGFYYDQLATGQCQYSTHDDENGRHMFCGEKCGPNSVYCAGHKAIVIRKR